MVANGNESPASFDLRTAAALRAMRPFGAIVAVLIIAATLLAPPLSALLVLVWLWLSRTPFREIGLGRPENWLATLILGIATGVAAKLLMKAVVMPYLGAPATNPILAEYVGNLEATLVATVEMIILAGLAEEIVFRGFMFNRLQAAFGEGLFARTLMIVGASCFFGGLHYFGQGYFGAIHATILGFAFSVIYFLNGQKLWYLVATHAAFDVTAVWLTYFGLESVVAHSVFG